MIHVTKPSLPDLAQLLPMLEDMWSSGVLSNGGPYHAELERNLTEALNLKALSLFCNATIALMTAQQALGIKGKVITTPYSFVATSNALTWLQNEPIFVDVEPDSLCLDPSKIEAAMSDDVVAIMPLHCYGNTCDTAAIADMASHYGLKVIYDACHSFGVEDDGGSVLRHGDISVVSFHATKVFNTFEGGMLVTSDTVTKKKVDHLKNFGFVDETTVIEAGLNGKMSEFNAALGLLQLQRIGQIFEERGAIDQLYREMLDQIPGVRCLDPVRQTTRNYSYFPIFIGSEYALSRDGLYDLLRRNGIHARRYFYPLISDFPIYSSGSSSSRQNLPVAARAADEVICLPIYPDLPQEEVVRIAEIVVAASASRPRE